jgi:rare lipoprotein A
MALLAGSLLLSGCAETQLVSHWAKQITWPGQQESKGTYKIGNPYKVGSVWYYPEENFALRETGIASWYGPGFHAATTANGEVFDQNELTAAHRTLQMPSLVRVTNLENGRSVVVRVNDRGPFKHGRIMDVSRRAAELLGFANKGTARVRLDVLEKESRMLADAARRGEDTTRLTLADLQQGRTGGEDRPVVVAEAVDSGARRVAPPVKVASIATDTDTLPESLRTPTITVEELSAPDKPAARAAAPVAYSPYPAPAAVSSRPIPLAEGHMKAGRFMPAPVVEKVPVHPTGIFVQAGSFAVYNNAEQLTKRLVNIAPTIIDPVNVNGRKLYRVRLGPIASVAAADSVLEKVIRLGNVTPKIIKN